MKGFNSTSEIVDELERRFGRRLPPRERHSIQTKLGQKIEAQLRRVSNGSGGGAGLPDIVVEGLGAFEVCLSSVSKNSKGGRGDRQLLVDHPRAWLVQCFDAIRSQENGGIPTIGPLDFMDKIGQPHDVWQSLLARVVDELTGIQQPLFETDVVAIPAVPRYKGGLLLRYPGSKRWLSPAVLAAAAEIDMKRVVEPFIGAGGMAIALMREGLLVSGSDASRGLCALWNCVRYRPAELAAEVAAFTPTLDSFYAFKEMLREYSIEDEVKVALAKLVVHQMGYGTLGDMSGGPIGGRDQEGKKYQLDARWSVSSLIQRIYTFHELFVKSLDGRVRAVPFSEIVDDRPGLVYVDPPYYGPGEALYLERVNHRQLCEYLERHRRPWILSYDDVGEVREMYADYPFIEVVTKPKVVNPASGRLPQRELVITNNQRIHAVLDDWAADYQGFVA